MVTAVEINLSQKKVFTLAITFVLVSLGAVGWIQSTTGYLHDTIVEENRKLNDRVVALENIVRDGFTATDKLIVLSKDELVLQAEKTRDLEVEQAEMTRGHVKDEGNASRKSITLHAVSIRTAINDQGASIRNNLSSNNQNIMRELGYISGAIDVRGKQHAPQHDEKE